MTTTRRGRVVDAVGSPVAGALVTVEWGTAPTPEITLISDADGRFRLGLPRGRFRLRATAPDGASGVTEAQGGAATPAIVIRVGSER